MRPFFTRDYLVVKIDVDRMQHGKEIAARFTGGKSTGLPWCAIVDTSGQILVTSTGPDGNIGCPVQPSERAHFRTMVEQTARTLSDAEKKQIADELDRFGDAILDARKPREE